MKVVSPCALQLSREQLVSALRAAGYKIPDDAQIAIDNGMEYDDRHAASVGEDGPLVVSWKIEVDVGGPE